MGFFLWFLSPVFLSPPVFRLGTPPCWDSLGFSVVCLSVRLLSILRGRGWRDTGAPGRRDISGAAVAPAGQVCGGFAFPPPYGRCDPRSCHSAGLWCPSRNSSRIHSACSVGPNPALSCAGCPGLVCHSVGGWQGMTPWGQGPGSWDPHLAWQLGAEPAPAKSSWGSSGLGWEGLGRAEVQEGGCTLTPSRARDVGGRCGGDVRRSFPSSVFWSLSRENQPQDPAPLIALSHSPGVRDSQQ